MVSTIVATNSLHAHRCGDICLKCSQAHLRLQDMSLQNYFLGVSHVWADPSVRLRTARQFLEVLCPQWLQWLQHKIQRRNSNSLPFRCVLASDFLGRSKLMFPKTMMGSWMASSKSKNHTVSFGRWEWSFKVQMENQKNLGNHQQALLHLSKKVVQCCSSSNPLQTTWDVEASSNEKDVLGAGWLVSHLPSSGFVWKCWVNIPNEIAI